MPWLLEHLLKQKQQPEKEASGEHGKWPEGLTGIKTGLHPSVTPSWAPAAPIGSDKTPSYQLITLAPRGLPRKGTEICGPSGQICVSAP